MHLQLSKEALLPAVQSAAAAANDKASTPILGHIHLQTESGDPTLTVTGTDLEVEVQAEAAAEVSESGEATVPAQKLRSIVQALPPEAQVTLKGDGGTIRLQSARSRFKLAGLNPADFPSITLEADPETLTVPQNVLKALLDRTAFAMARDDVRYYLNGLLLEWQGTHLRTVATDGHRLALADQAVGDGPEESRLALLPRKGVQEVQRLLGDREDAVELALAADHARFALPGVRLTTKLIAAQFPDYKRIIPEADGHRLTVEREALLGALKRVAVLIDQKNQPGVQLDVADGTLALSAQNRDAEAADEQLTAAYEGEPMAIGMNISYLQQAVQALPTEEAVLVLQDPTSSALVLPGEATGQTNVVMPMRL